MYLTEKKAYKKACYDLMKQYMKYSKKTNPKSKKFREDNAKLNLLFSKGKYCTILDIIYGHIDIDDVTLENAYSTSKEKWDQARKEIAEKYNIRSNSSSRVSIGSWISF